MKIAFIMKGLPGSGKSSIAELLYTTSKSSIIHSTDNYHIVNGKYKFNKERLWEFHETNLEAFKKSCKKGIKVVICDNTNIKKVFYSNYVKIAKKHGYKVHIITIGDFNATACWKRNKHKVPLKVIRSMKRNFVLY
jgi:tRNA uridine 5-carbamoylmethylation protein Kti12